MPEMNRVKRCCLAAMVMIVFQAYADGTAALRRAYEEGAVARVRCCVVDEEGIPLSNVTVRVSFKSTVRTSDNQDVCVRTNGEGRFDVSRRTNWKVGVWVGKNGYYDSRFEVSFYDTGRNKVEDGKWDHDGLNRKIVMRKIRAKHALVVFPEVKRMGTWKIPVKNEWVGFDFESFDWTVPYGNGRYKDVLLRFSSETVDHVHGHYQMELCFTNNPFAGAYVGIGDPWSDLKIPHVADPFRNYATYHCFVRNALGSVREDNFPKKEGYIVFRTRTRTDDNGKLTAACYGVVSGVWISGETTMRMEDAAFNPGENNVDIEDGYYLRQLLRQYDRRR